MRKHILYYITIYFLMTDVLRFRSRWAASLMKTGMKFDLYTMHRYWTTIMECQDPDAPLEQVLSLREARSVTFYHNSLFFHSILDLHCFILYVKRIVSINLDPYSGPCSSFKSPNYRTAH